MMYLRIPITSIFILMSLFDWIFYTNFHTDIKAACIKTEEKSLEHYTLHGLDEKRVTHIDIEKYLKTHDPYGELLLSTIENDSFYGVNHNFISCRNRRRSRLIFREYRYYF